MPARRTSRAAAKRAQQALESTPMTFDGIDDEDEPMPDAATQDDAEADRDAEDDAEKEDGSAAEEDAQEEDEESAKSPTPPPEPVVRRRRLGRPPKNRPPDWDTLPIEPPNPDATPRRRGRGGWRGRGGRKGQHYQPTQQSIDNAGTMMDIVNDEVDLPEDPEGEEKVDKLGNLKGGREYRCRTFTVAGRGERLYMLSTEPARCVGFRDSYLFFTKHKKLYKIIVNDEEKRDMIERDIIPHSYKGRSIGIVTARSVFREFGALIIVGGRRIIDDYEVAKARAEGVVEGELADPNDIYDPDKPYNKNQYVAWHGASSVYHSGGTSAPQQNVKVDTKKRRVAVNDVNWQLEHAREASQFNSILSAVRRNNLNGVYDIHTNQMHYPRIMQPTHARIEQVIDRDDSASKDGQRQASSSSSAVFPPLKPSIARNFLVMDMHLESPPAGVAPISYDLPFRPAAGNPDHEASAAADFLAPFKGLRAVSDDIRALLPEECRRAFDAAREREEKWLERWGDEKDVTSRKEPVVDKAVVPYSMMII
ncbi:hypothetical protein VTJ83DRAFT_4378 [Remersonia thermophila]|uniref:Chromatin structure-remodeling complex subunit rsc7 n=1 Tax=Remersonia thermophila TaxID=72144 RepID=A0ABR4D9S1_9PEZI